MSKVVYIGLCLLTAAAGSASSVQKSHAADNGKNVPAFKPPKGGMMPMPLIAPLFVESGAMSSTVTVVNGAAAKATAEVILLDRSGGQILKKAISLKGHSQQALKLSDILVTAKAAAPIGSVEIVPDPISAQAMSVVAQLSMVDDNTAPPTYLEEEFLMPSESGSNRYQAVASSVLGDPVLALRSLAATPQTISVECIQEHGREGNSVLNLAPGQMKLIRACTGRRNQIATIAGIWS